MSTTRSEEWNDGTHCEEALFNDLKSTGTALDIETGAPDPRSKTPLNSFKVMKELMRHSKMRTTMDAYIPGSCTPPNMPRKLPCWLCSFRSVTPHAMISSSERRTHVHV